jgi:hypothetical protein
MAGMSKREWPEWAQRRAKGNRIIGLALLGLVVLYVVLFVTRYVVR